MARSSGRPPGKRLVLLLDGTWNSQEDNTNVWRLNQLVARRDAAGIEQLCYYTAGVGTPRGEVIRGGALGYGLDRDVIAAYRWLMGHFDQKSDDYPGDHIFIFGFSRGAYTARSVAGMIARCGLLRPGSPLSVEELYARYRLDASAPSFVDLHQTKSITPAEKRLLRHSRRVPIKMIGVWDTVGALGIPFGNIPGLSRQQFAFHNTRLSTIFEYAYQALAIDEHRADFAPALWTRFTPVASETKPTRTTRRTQVEQRWFVGAHANVGGGIAGDDLAQLSLAWLMERAGSLGLAYRGQVVPAGHEALAPIHDSYASFLYGTYRIAKLGRRFQRVIAAPAKDVDGGSVASVNESIDASVFDRWRKLPHYRPPNLVRWAAGFGLDPTEIHGPIDARTGKPAAAAAAPSLPTVSPPSKEES